MNCKRIFPIILIAMSFVCFGRIDFVKAQSSKKAAVKRDWRAYAHYAKTSVQAGQCVKALRYRLKAVELIDASKVSKTDPTLVDFLGSDFCAAYLGVLIEREGKQPYTQLNYLCDNEYETIKKKFGTTGLPIVMVTNNKVFNYGQVLNPVENRENLKKQFESQRKKLAAKLNKNEDRLFMRELKETISISMALLKRETERAEARKKSN